MSADGAPYGDRVRAWSSTARWRAEAGALLDVLALPAHSEVLDVGAGAGAMMPLLHGRALTAFGLDRWHGWSTLPAGGALARGDARRLPFGSGAFDAVLLHHVIAHVQDPAHALAEARRVLRPSGRLGIATPNAWFVRALALPSLATGHRKDPTVVKHLTAGSLCRLVRSAGMRVLRVERLGGLPWTCPFPPLRERILLVAEPAA